MKRVRLKYCGGCNPVYDRERYVAAIREVAGARVDWVDSDTEGITDILMINGCERACAQEELGGKAAGARVISVQDGLARPEEVVRLLLAGTGCGRPPEPGKGDSSGREPLTTATPERRGLGQRR